MTDPNPTPTAAPASGRTSPEARWLQRAVGDAYAVERLLGRGGMGVVYLALDRVLQRWVAIKALLPEYGTDPDRREAFRREALANARLAHPNIVPVHAYGEADETAYIVMRYVPGHSLAYVLWRGEPLLVPRTCEILAELADALDYAHRQRVVHKDIKPENVILDQDTGRPMLTDFGIARAVSLDAMLAQDIQAERGLVRGTVHFMSPEQAAGTHDLDGRSDIDSLGVLGYALLTGTLPFEGGTFAQIAAKHGTEPPPPIEDRAKDVPAGVARAIVRCLAKRPDARWPDGAALRQALIEEGVDPGRWRSPLARVRRALGGALRRR